VLDRRAIYFQVMPAADMLKNLSQGDSPMRSTPRTMLRLLILLAMGACASAPRVPPTSRPAPGAFPSLAAGEKCDPEDYSTRPPPDKLLIDSAWRAEPRLDEMRVFLHAPVSLVRQKVTAAMLACNIPLAESGEGVIEARYGEQTGMVGNYTLITHAYVVSLDDSTTLVRLSGQETSKRGYAINPTISTLPITNKNMGRSLSGWLALRNVAKQLRADPALRADVERSTPLGLVYAR
jgi:hypothetical protein